MGDSPRSSVTRRLASSVLGPSMLTLRDIAQFLGVEYRTIQKWRAEGVLPPADFAMGRVVRWRRATVEAFIADRAGMGRTVPEQEVRHAS